MQWQRGHLCSLEPAIPGSPSSRLLLGRLLTLSGMWLLGDHGFWGSFPPFSAKEEAGLSGFFPRYQEWVGLVSLGAELRSEDSRKEASILLGN